MFIPTQLGNFIPTYLGIFTPTKLGKSKPTLTNNKIVNVIKRAAFGFRDLDYFILKIRRSCKFKKFV
ncbi:hypothetical protein J2T61_001551 [Methanocalculus sp. AMF5]|nr:hypothetical protein [Methanocalculus sp. AMF5]